MWKATGHAYRTRHRGRGPRSSATARRPRSTASTSTCPRGSVCGAARAQRRRQDDRRAHPHHAAPTPTRAAPPWPASTSPRDPTEVRRRIGLAAQDATVDGLLTGRENLVMIGELHHLGRAGRARPRRRAARAVRPRRRRATASSRPTPAACAGGSTWPRRWSPRPRCCSSTSPPPASTRAPATSSGTCSRRLVGEGATHPPDHAVPRGGRPPRRRHRGGRPRARHRPRRRPRAQAPGRRRPAAGRRRPPRRRRRASPSSSAASAAPGRPSTAPTRLVTAPTAEGVRAHRASSPTRWPTTTSRSRTSGCASPRSTTSS